MDFASTGTTDRWFDEVRRELEKLNDGANYVAHATTISRATKLCYALLTMLQREVAILPPMNRAPTAAEVSAYWRDKYDAYNSIYLTIKKFHLVRDRRAKEMASAIEQTFSGLSEVRYHLESFVDWLLGKPNAVSNHGPPPEDAATNHGSATAWCREIPPYNKPYWGPTLVAYKTRVLDALQRWQDSTREFIGVAMTVFSKEDDAETRKTVAAGAGIQLKRGEKIGTLDRIPRGGSINGFAVSNDVGVSMHAYSAAAQLLNSVRQILSRKNLDGATRNIPVKYLARSQYSQKVHVAATGQDLFAAGYYFPSNRSIGIIFNDEESRQAIDAVPQVVPWEMVGTLLHEIGHYYYFNRLSAAAKAYHEKRWRTASSFPSSYARNSAVEDWAELWTAYLGRQYYKDGHQGYTLTNECWDRFKSTIAMDPRLKEIAKMVAEAQEDDWSCKLLSEVSAVEAAWDDKLSSYVMESRFEDFGSLAAKLESIVKSLHSLVKGGGFFKSEAQAKFLHGTARQIADKIPNPSRWFSAFDPTKHTALYTVSKIPWAGHTDVTKIRYSSHGFILDGQGVVCRLKFKVAVKPGAEDYGEVLFDQGVVDFQRPAGASGSVQFDLFGHEAQKKRELDDKIAKNQPLIAQIKSIPGWDKSDSPDNILASFVAQLATGRTLSPKQIEIVNRYSRKSGIEGLVQDWVSWQSCLDFIVKKVEAVLPHATTMYQQRRDKEMGSHEDMRMGSYAPWNDLLWKDFPPDKAVRMYRETLHAVAAGNTSWDPQPLDWEVRYALQDTGMDVTSLNLTDFLSALHDVTVVIGKAKSKGRITKAQTTLMYTLMQLAKKAGWNP